jgi:hypothetical protein
MPAEVNPADIQANRWDSRAVAVAVMLFLALMATAWASMRPAGAQTVGPQVTQFPGVTYDYVGARGEVHTFTTSCPAGYFAMAGGWSTQGTAAFAVPNSYPSQLPGGGGAGTWELTVRKLDKGTLTVTPWVSCLGGVSQLPE